MTNSPQWPLLNNAQTSTAEAPDAQVTESERDRAERLLHQAFRDGRINVADFEQRFTRAMNASKMSQLRTAVADMPAPVNRAVTSVHNYYRASTGAPQHNVLVASAHRQQSSTERDAAIAGLAHASGIFTWILGPALFYANAKPGTFLRVQAAKAFNFQLTAGLLFIGASIALGILGLGGLTALMSLAWLGLTIVSAVKAGKGEDWDNPVSQWFKWQPMQTDGR